MKTSLKGRGGFLFPEGFFHLDQDLPEFNSMFFHGQGGLIGITGQNRLNNRAVHPCRVDKLKIRFGRLNNPQGQLYKRADHGLKKSIAAHFRQDEMDGRLPRRVEGRRPPRAACLGPPVFSPVLLGPAVSAIDVISGPISWRNDRDLEVGVIFAS